jgi:broad specificity phosphatase PhoE
MAVLVPPALTWLVRHGQSASNAGLPATGQHDVALTALGHEQAQAVARRLERPPDLVVVSPFLRARATAQPMLARWPGTRCETWPIHELTYLSPARCVGTTPLVRRPWIEAYWRRCDPEHCDGADAESFHAFVDRLRDFHRRLAGLDAEFVVAVGHGHFFRAFLIGLRGGGFDHSARWMRAYRAAETAQPMANGEIFEVGGDELRSARPQDAACDGPAQGGVTPR